jgi:hypothetical protein
MKLNTIFNYLFKALWAILFFLIIFINRDNQLMVICTISLLVILAFITILRSIDSRNEWRKIIEDGDVEIKDKIEF